MRLRFLAAALLIQSSTAFAGAWGEGSFENDDALDWIWELEQGNGFSAIEAALQLDPRAELLEAPQCSTALAAAEVVGAAHGQPAQELPPEVVGWLGINRGKVPGELLLAARQAVAVCSDSEHSELRQLWRESASADEWHAATSNLLSRLRAAIQETVGPSAG